MTGAATQRRTLALLAVLAVAADHGMSRDKLLGLLWPESDSERARHSLTQALYAARRALQRDDLFLAGTDVRLDSERLTSDVRELEGALDDGELERAVGLYDGPFLDGFFLSGSTEFEQWMTAQRERLHIRVTDALERLAARSAEQGDPRGELEWRRRLTALLPLDAGAAVKLMTAMATVGDRAGAVQHARVHAALLREQLDLDPDPVVEALAARFRDSADWIPAPSIVREPDVAARQESVAPQVMASRTSATPDGPHVGTALTAEVGVWVPVRRASSSWRRWGIAAFLVLILVGSGVLVGRRADRASTVRALAVPQRVVVAPFRVSGADASLAYLREGMVELLSTRLADDTAARSVDAGAVLGAWRAAGLTGAANVGRDTVVKLAAQLGAERVVVGSVVGTRSGAILSATVLLVPQGTVSAQAIVSGAADSITSLIDRLAARLLVSEAGQDESLAQYTSHSLPALQAFLAGQSAYRQSEFSRALVSYDRALRRDSSFALAGLYKALTADRLNVESSFRGGVRIAWTFRANLNERDHALLEALVGPRDGALPTSAEQTAAWQRIVDRAPSSGDAWYALSVRLLKDGASASLPSSRQQAIISLRRALTVSPRHEPATDLLARLDVRTPATGTDTAGATSAATRWHTAVVREDSATRRRLRNEFSRFPAADLRAVATISQFEGIAFDDGARAIAVLQSSVGTDVDRADLLLAQHSMSLNRGRIDDALESTSRLRRLQPGSDAWLRLRVLDVLYADGDAAAGMDAARALVERTSATPVSVPTSWDGWLANACVVGQWRLARDDTTGVRAFVELLRARRTTDPSTRVSATPHACAELLDAALAVATRRRDARMRVQRLDSLVFTPQGAGDASTYASIAIARLFERVGDPADALRAIRMRPYLSGWPRYLATAWREEGRLAERAGDPRAARIAYDRFLIYRGATPSATTDEVRERLRVLALAP